ncbi:outer membrane lipoprotein carrier protein LolA [Lutimonas saemankumensis]|uniref:LolA family protein n=1 Tax=Lutimonas saemankumensis TaxID=483016 RepID=UPI001CD6AF23|nr:outer membrane lipoprotein carrier protein LolA [Lutimonas saemankumensis]MCA0931121.1 outer membrane lipoprotein carrier protein LolA [Lutimonas saemankumensis]
MNRSRLNFKVISSLFMGLIWISSMNGQNDASAKSILDNASSTMSAYKNLSMDFDYVLDNRAEDVTQEMSGDVLLQGEKYVVNLFGSTQIFDGVKTYTIIPENEEVNISEADIDEENTFTPSKFYSFYKSGYTYKMDELKKIGGKNIQFVQLTPIDSNSEIKSILVGIDTKTNHIYQIIEIGNNETRTILTAKNIKTNQEINGKVFVFNEKKYEDLNYMINK